MAIKFEYKSIDFDAASLSTDVSMTVAEWRDLMDQLPSHAPMCQKMKGKIQEMLKYNMDKLRASATDTARLDR